MRSLGTASDLQGVKPVQDKGEVEAGDLESMTRVLPPNRESSPYPKGSLPSRVGPEGPGEGIRPGPQRKNGASVLGPAWPVWCHKRPP